MDEKLINERYLKKIAFNPQYYPIDISNDDDVKVKYNGKPGDAYHLISWLASDFDGTLLTFTAKDVDTAARLITFDEKMYPLILKILKSKDLNLFYANEKLPDSNDILVMVVGRDRQNTEKASIDLDKIYTNDPEYFFKILRAEGIKVR